MVGDGDHADHVTKFCGVIKIVIENNNFYVFLIYKLTIKYPTQNKSFIKSYTENYKHQYSVTL